MSEFTQYLKLSPETSKTIEGFEERGSNPTGVRITDHDVRQIAERCYREGFVGGAIVAKRSVGRLGTLVADVAMVVLAASFTLNLVGNLLAGNWDDQVDISDIGLLLVWWLIGCAYLFMPLRSNTKSVYQLLRSRWTKKIDTETHSENVDTERG